MLEYRDGLQPEVADVCVIGLGYIGLPTAVTLTNNFQNVIGVDVDEDKVRVINSGNAPFFEKGLSEALRKAVEEGKFRASVSVPRARNYIIAVPTPVDENHEVDLSAVWDAGDQISELIVGNELVVLESTSPPGTTTELSERIKKNRPDCNFEAFSVAHCPERVLPGNILYELRSNDRVVGGTTKSATESAAKLYSTITQGEILKTDSSTAEMVKLAENTYRDINIAFANELSMQSDEIGIDICELISLANRHPRVDILRPGPGVGGHCIAVDPWILAQSFPTVSNLTRMARSVNERKTQWVIDKLGARIQASQAVTLGVFGLAFKADVDDVRNSPAIRIIQEIYKQFPDLEILVVEPFLSLAPAELREVNVRLASIDCTLKKSDVLAILVDHSAFTSVDWDSVSHKPIVDTRGHC